VQGRGSGADVAASVYGGIVAYRAKPLEIQPLTERHPADRGVFRQQAAHAGGGAHRQRAGPQFPQLFDLLFDLMDRCSMDAFEAIQRATGKSFGAILNIGQGLMDAMGVNNEALSSIINALRADPGILGAKISGSGLGDCAIGWGRTSSDFPFPVIPVEPAPQGLMMD
jgi:mevalonate kinase